MKVVSTNIGEPRFVSINDEQQQTGIFKKPTNKPIYLCKDHVQGDEISNKQVHGGEFKACYLFCADNYPYWKNLYPNLVWHYGMLGENVTIKGLDETKLYVGDIYKLGSAVVEITQPREPCATLAAKIGSSEIIQQFIEHCKPGTYTRVLETGYVAIGDTMTLLKKASYSISIADFYRTLFEREKNQKYLECIMLSDSIPLKKREQLKRFINK